LSRPRGFE